MSTGFRSRCWMSRSADGGCYVLSRLCEGLVQFPVIGSDCC